MDARAIAEWFRLFEWSPITPAWSQQRKAIWAWRKLRKAVRWVRVLRFVPFVRMIAIGNDLGYGNCSDASDIDLVIVTAPRRVWFVRLLVVTILRLFRQRPGEHTRDAICPSFFLTTEAMDLESMQIGQGSKEAKGQNILRSSLFASLPVASLPSDPYLLFWATQLTVLCDRGGTYAAFWRANESWVRRWLPDARPRAMHPRLSVGTLPPLSPLPQGGGEARKFSPLPSRRGSERGWGARLGDALDAWCRTFQEQRLSSEVRALANRDSRVVITDRMLKFHANDRRQEYRDRWLQRLVGV